MNFEEIEEIEVRFKNGDTIIYKGKGVAKFKNILIKDIMSQTSTAGMDTYKTVNLDYSTDKKMSRNLSITDMAEKMRKDSNIDFA